jgi:hypothetical protein
MVDFNGNEQSEDDGEDVDQEDVWRTNRSGRANPR